MNSRLDIDALQALLAVEAHGGVTRAAEKLNLTQPAVSHKIKRLETQLGTPLLTRRSSADLFTQEGYRLLGYAKRILDLHDEAIASIEQNPLNGTLRLSGLLGGPFSINTALIIGDEWNCRLKCDWEI